MKDTVYNTIGSRLKDKLTSCDITLSELAEDLGCSRQRVEDICEDRTEMTQEELVKAAGALNTSEKYLSLRSGCDLPREYADAAERLNLCIK